MILRSLDRKFCFRRSRKLCFRDLSRKLCLYINTKDREAISVALKKGKVIVERLEDNNKFGSQVLLPLITKILKKNNLEFKDLTGVEVEEGPGSFTGLKVGASVAQALGYA
ncbi:MAG: hypothetical protein Q7S88_03360 [Candidatus Daviesbacteria bacterium]|nr:hypothetical protein [Candidatus Daviesbacteria bacterium]